MGMHDHFAPFWTLVSRFAGSRGVALGFHILCLWHRMALFWSLRFPAFAYTSRLAGTAHRLVRPIEIRDCPSCPIAAQTVGVNARYSVQRLVKLTFHWYGSDR